MSLKDTVKRLVSARPMRVDELLRHEEIKPLTQQSSRVSNVLAALMRDGDVVFRPDGRYGPPGPAVSRMGEKCLVLTRLESWARKRNEPEVAEVLAEIRADLGLVSAKKAG